MLPPSAIIFEAVAKIILFLGKDKKKQPSIGQPPELVLQELTSRIYLLQKEMQFALIELHSLITLLTGCFPTDIVVLSFSSVGR